MPRKRASVVVEGPVAPAPKAMDRGIPINLRDSIWIVGIVVSIVSFYFKGQIDSEAKARAIAKEEVNSQMATVSYRLGELSDAVHTLGDKMDNLRDRR